MHLRRTLLPFVLAPLALTACGGSDEEPIFVVRTTQQAVASTAPILVRVVQLAR